MINKLNTALQPVDVREWSDIGILHRHKYVFLSGKKLSADHSTILEVLFEAELFNARDCVRYRVRAVSNLLFWKSINAKKKFAKADRKFLRK